MNKRVVKVVPKFRASHAIQWLPDEGCTLSHIVDLFESKYKVTENHPYEVFLTGRRGKLMVTITQVDDRLQIYLRKGVFREVYPTFWIVVDDNLEVMVLSEQEFRDTHDFKSNTTTPIMSMKDMDFAEMEWDIGTARRNGSD